MNHTCASTHILDRYVNLETWEPGETFKAALNNALEKMVEDGVIADETSEFAKVILAVRLSFLEMAPVGA